jgi:hypothetical protein
VGSSCGEHRRIACEACRQRDHATNGRRGVFGPTRILEHPFETRHVDDVECERSRAQSIDPVLAITLAQTQETVGLAQSHPGHGSTKEPLGERAHLLSLLARTAEDGIDVAQAHAAFPDG